MDALRLSTEPPTLPIDVNGEIIGQLRHWYSLTQSERTIVGRHDNLVLELAKKGKSPTPSQRHRVLQIIVETDDMGKIMNLPEATQGGIIAGINMSVNNPTEWTDPGDTAAERVQHAMNQGWEDDDVADDTQSAEGEVSQVGAD